MASSIDKEMTRIETVFIQTCDFPFEKAAFLGLGQGGDILHEDEVERTPVKVESQSNGKEMPHELAAGIVGRAGAVCLREALARRATDYPRRSEPASMVAVHVGQPDRRQVRDIAKRALRPVAVPSGDRVSTDVIGQADVETRPLEAEIQPSAT